MKRATIMLGLLLLASSASALDIQKAFDNLQKQSIDSLLKLGEQVLTDKQRGVLDKELTKREGDMNKEQQERWQHKKQKGHGRDHAPGQMKKYAQDDKKGNKHRKEH